MHDSAMMTMAYFRDKYMDKNKITKIVDIGSMDINGSFRDLLNEKLWMYQGVDIEEGRNVDTVLKDPHSWKELKDEDYDVVISGNTFEHIKFPWLAIKEVYRILRPQGIACILAPSEAPIHGFPLDCWRIQFDGMSALCEWSGLKSLEVMNTGIPGGCVTDSVLIAQKI